MKYYYFFSHLTCLDIFLGDLRANAVLASYTRSSDLSKHMIDTFNNIYDIKLLCEKDVYRDVFVLNHYRAHLIVQSAHSLERA